MKDKKLPPLAAEFVKKAAPLMAVSFMTKRRSHAPKVTFGKNPNKTRTSETVPNQSLSMREIMRRFTKGIPMDDKNQVPVYVEQNELDLEKLSRLDFAEQAAYADFLRDRNEAANAELKARIQKRREDDEFMRRTKEAEAKRQESEAKQAAAKTDTGIVVP